MTIPRGLVLLVCIVLAACTPAPGLDALTRGETGKVAHVQSGEVVVLASGLVVRLAGIEAPNGDEPHAVEAADKLRGLVEGREVVLLYGGERRDRYGRALAQVRRRSDRLWVQGAMLRDGAARVRTYPDNRAMTRAMLHAEARARIAGRGLWALPAYRVLLPGEVAPHASGYLLIEGRARPTGPLEFRLAGNERMRFVIAPRAARDFRQLGVVAAKLEGRLVRVRGQLGPDGTLRLDHPETLEILQEPRTGH